MDGRLTFQNHRDSNPYEVFLRLCCFISGIVQDIDKYKTDKVHRNGTEAITDITDGTAYKELLCAEDGFLTMPFNLTGILNTDGVNLYSSSKVELWPVFLAINELSPKIRFSRENMLLIGIWQGKGKPPFKQFFASLGDELNSLYNGGVEVNVNGKDILAKLAVVCGVFDLPAKASILNMTYFNGKEGCITCEDPGKRVKQGKGTSHCYPFRNIDSHYPGRNHDTVKEYMREATDKKRVKGFIGTSGLTNLETYDLVKGTVPDYMHGILLGITKTLLCKWFSPTQSGNPYFIGKHLKTVSKRLNKIKPPPFIERLPRDLEKHYQHFKATELQAWLLFYSLPCLSDILPFAYLRHFAYLSEAIYIVLGDNITPTKLDRASMLLNKFYQEFEELYGPGSCGLNVHNACAHLIWYVKLWGPAWAWSCFPFEDANAMLLQSCHGTGNVMKQVMRYKEVQLNMRSKGMESSSTTRWKVTSSANNCDICGKMKPFSKEIFFNEVADNHGVNLGNVKQLDRICVNGKQFCSEDYIRMEKRVCSVVLCDDGSVGRILCFLLDEISDTVYAILQMFQTHIDAEISQLGAGKHIIPVSETQQKKMILVEQLSHILLYIHISLTDASNVHYVAQLPNAHGHAIFK